jgi:two-component system sensor histidine kinase DegS
MNDNKDNKDILDPNIKNQCHLIDALEFVKEMNINTEDKIQALQNDILSLEASKIQMEATILNLDNLNNESANYFSPSIGNKKAAHIEDYENQISNLSNCIIEKEREMEYYTIKLNRIENLNECLSHLEFFSMNHFKNIYKSVPSTNETVSPRFGINLLHAQENERKRIARDLHDSTVQSLTNLKHKSELITRLIDIDAVRAKLELQTMILTLKSTIDEMRSIIYDLRPMSIDDLGLTATINKYVNEIKTTNSVDIIFNVINTEYSVLPVINLTLFRIIQEATTNALKHANATKITINLDYCCTNIILSICDNGIGFNPDELGTSDDNQSKFNGFGLSIMRERIFLLAGKIEIISDELKGTQIIVSVPTETARTYTEDN